MHSVLKSASVSLLLKGERWSGWRFAGACGSMLQFAVAREKNASNGSFVPQRWPTLSNLISGLWNRHLLSEGGVPRIELSFV